jgi:hypothetical protein
MHWRKEGKICPTCDKLRSKRSYVLGFENCAHCSYHELVFKEYKQCPYCRNWLHLTAMPGKLCPACQKKFMDRHWKYGRQRLPKNIPILCDSCNEEKHISSYRISNRSTCRKCIFWKQQQDEGKRRCQSCMSWFPIEDFPTKKYCQRCRVKENTRNLYALREMRKDPKWKEYYREYSRYYYHNIFKIHYHKILHLQACYGLAKKRKINRNGYWYMLNHSFFKEIKYNVGGWIKYTDKVINFLKTGRGRIVGDQVIIDRPSKKFKDYCDSDEGMTASERPKFHVKSFHVSQIPDDL